VVSPGARSERDQASSNGDSEEDTFHMVGF
jgi:hypothetical protein